MKDDGSIYYLVQRGRGNYPDNYRWFTFPGGGPLATLWTVQESHCYGFNNCLRACANKETSKSYKNSV